MIEYCAIDFETYLISAEEPVPRPICLSYYYIDEKEPEGLLKGMDDMEAFLKKILLSKTKIIAHNAKFEVLVINQHFPKLKKLLENKINRKEIICTQVYEQLLDCIREKPLFSTALDKVVNHYFKVDISGDKKAKEPFNQFVMFSYGETTGFEYECTKCTHRVPKKAPKVCPKCGNKKADEPWRLRYHELVDVELEDWPKEAVRYAIEDSVWAYKVHMEQKKTHVDADLSISADIYLNMMGETGITIGRDRVELLEKELLDVLTPKYKKLVEVGLTKYVEKEKRYKKNMKFLREYIETNVKDVEHTAKGTVATSSTSINRYIATTDNIEVKEILQDYVDIMKHEKILTAFVKRLLQADPLIRTNYKAVVSSGRTSSSSSKFYASVNIQQMPRSVEGVTWDIRNCFVPRKGYKICSIDYAGLELASTAHQLYTLTGKSNMRDTVNRGDTPTDMHSMFAYRIMNLKEKTNETYESFVARKKEKPYSSYRQLAKPINLGFPGGIGYDTMRELLAKSGITPKLVVLETSKYEASLVWKRSKCRKEGYPVRIRRIGVREFQLVYDELYLLKQELFSLYPDLEEFLKEEHKQYLTGKTKLMKNEYGEWEKEPMYKFEIGNKEFSRDWCMYTQVCNGLLMQSPAAIGAKKAMVKIIQQYKDSKAIIPLAFIHDEILLEVIDGPHTKDLVKDVSEILIDEMQTVLTSVRIAVEAELCGDYWRKAGGEWSMEFWKDAGSDTLKSDKT